MTTVHKNALTPWVVIIPLLIVFWPVGLWLMARRVSRDAKVVAYGGFIVAATGLILLVAGFIFAIPTGETGAVVFLSCALLFIAALPTGIVLQIRGWKYGRYLNLVRNQQITSLDTLASVMHRSRSKVERDLTAMARLGFFPGVRFVNQEAEQRKKAVQESIRSANTLTVSCPNCGAQTPVLRGSASVCEYCGSVLHADAPKAQVK